MEMRLWCFTAQPVFIVEALQAQIQRRMQVLRTANITDDPSVLLDDICDQINNQKRPDRGNLTPLQLLNLNEAGRKAVNDRKKPDPILGHFLKPLKVGDTVRYLLWNRKQQVAGMGGKYKGFAPKWSPETFTVLQMKAMRRNAGHHYYNIGRGQMYLRHELLKIPRKVDRKVPKGFVEFKQRVIPAGGQDEWEEGGFDSDDSRYGE